MARRPRRDYRFVVVRALRNNIDRHCPRPLAAISQNAQEMPTPLKLCLGHGNCSFAIAHMFESHRSTRECPRCRRDRAQFLRSMRKHSSLDWFKCDVCEHLFSDDGSSSGEGLASLDKKPQTAA
jgi:hypothetical protein